MGKLYGVSNLWRSTLLTSICRTSNLRAGVVLTAQLPLHIDESHGCRIDFIQVSVLLNSSNMYSLRPGFFSVKVS